MSRTEISAAEAVKLFKDQKIRVQTATPTKVKGDDGIERPAMATDSVSLKAEHIVAAARYDSGTVRIVTVDGRRYEAAAAAAA